MKLKLQNEIELSAGKKSLEILKLNTSIFPNWNKNEISVLSDYMRFLTFQKSSFLATKGEEVDYFGIIISGRALVQVDSKVYGYLETGDMVGYMGITKMPGSQIHHFDIVGEKTGIIAAIRTEDLKLLTKREPIVSYKLNQIMSKKCYDIIQQQYKNQSKPSKKQQQKLEPSTMPTKRISELFENIPSLQYFINVIEKRDKKYLLTNSQLYEFQSEQQIILEGDKNCLIILLKGELISFSKGKQPHVYKPGNIIGKQEYFQDSCFKENIYGRYQGVFLKITKEIMEDISIQNSQSACNILNLIMRCDCLDLKNQYETEHEEFNSFKKKYRSQVEEQQELDSMMQRLKQDALDKEKQQKDAKQERINKKKNGLLSDATQQKDDKKDSPQKQQSKKLKRPEDIDDIFVELDVNKKITLQQLNKVDKLLEEFKEYQRDFEIAPLYIHDVYKDQIENNDQMESSKPKKNIKNDGISTFYQEKMTQQQLEKQAYIQELKQLKRKKLITEEEYQQKLKQKSAPVVDDGVDDYEELKNELTILSGDKRQLEELVLELKQENLDLRQEIKQQQSDMQMLKARVNKSNLQKELLGKGLRESSEQNGSSYLQLNKRAQQQKDKFNDVLDDQIKYNKRIQFITKCARKWLRVTRERIYQKKFNQTQNQFTNNMSTPNFSRSAYY